MLTKRDKKKIRKIVDEIVKWHAGNGEHTKTHCATECEKYSDKIFLESGDSITTPRYAPWVKEEFVEIKESARERT